MSKPSKRKPSRPATQPLEGLNHTVLAGADGTIRSDDVEPMADNRLMVLEVLSGGRRGLIKRCNKDKFRLGRRSHNDLSFDGKEDRAVSGNHLLLERRPDGWWAQDLKSTNGTLLNGKPLTAPASLTSEDILELGRRPEMGTGGTVKLRLRFEAAGEGEEEETQEEATRLRPGDEAATSTRSPASATISATSTAVPADEHEPLTIEQTAKTPQPASPAPQAQKQPAKEKSAPTAKLLADLQDKTLMLGKVSYRLEDLLAGLCRAALEDDKIDVLKLKGGSDLMAGIETRAKLIADCEKAYEDLAGHGSFANAQINPLETAAKSMETELAKARKAAEDASKVSASASDALSKLDGDARSTLREMLSDVTKGLASDTQSIPKAKPGADGAPQGAPEIRPPWTGWIQALEKSTADLQERKPKLEKAAKLASEARAALESAESVARELNLKHAEAADALEAKTAAMTTRKAELESEVARLSAASEPAEDQERESMADFAEANLTADGAPLAALAGHAKALSLTEQRKSLEAEVEGLRKQLGA